MTRSIAASILSCLLIASCGAKQPSQSNLKNEFSGLAFHYIDKEDRIKVLSQLKDEIEARYALLELKKTRLGVDHEKLFAAAFDAEKASVDPGDEVPLEQAQAQMAFIDRARKLISGYRDTHFGIGGLVRRPSITNGLRLAEVDGHFIVIKINPKILGYTALHSNTDAAKEIALGDEVVSIDGESVESRVKTLMDYESASSVGYARASATQAVTYRNYLYPEKSNSVFELKKSNGKNVKIVLSWYYDISKNRRDAIMLLESRGIKGMKGMLETWNNATKRWEDSTAIWQGFSQYDAPQGAVGTKTWHDSSDPSEVVMQTGYILKNGKSYGFIQLYTYMLSQVTQKAGDPAVSWATPMTQFINELKASKTPLIFDIRENGGGWISIPPKILAMIAKEKDSYPSVRAGFRITSYTRGLIDLWNDGLLADLNDTSDLTLALPAMEEAVKNKWKHTMMYSRGTVEANADIGGYELPVVALITPDCISSCDIQSFLLKGSKRVTLIGTHSNGTGAGFYGDGPFSPGPWSDRLSVLTTQIPNFLFGYSADPQATASDGDKSVAKFDTENIPTTADVQYSSTKEDYLNRSVGWYAKAIEVLNQRP